MKLIKSKISEFGFYESIIHGDLRPFLPKYSSEKYLESLAKLHKKTFEDEDKEFFEEIENLSDEAKVVKLDDKKTDQVENKNALISIEKIPVSRFTIDQLKIIERHTRRAVEVGDLESIERLARLLPGVDIDWETGDLDALCDFTSEEPTYEVMNMKESLCEWLPFPPRPPDKKAEIFLSQIEKEFDAIKKRAEKFLCDVQKDKQISQFANQNIQKAKKLAIDSGYLSRLLKPEDSNSLGDSDSYIIYFLADFLIRSILYYQSLFEPFLNTPLDTEAELKAIVDNPYVFALKGDYWKINFNREETLIKDLERIRYIAHLLENPNEEFYCHNLTALVKGSNPEVNQHYSEIGEEKLQQENLSLVDLNIEQLSQDEKEKIENMAYDAWEKVTNSSNNPNTKEKAKREWESVKGYLLKEHGIMTFSSKKGLSFKIKARLTKDFEKARSNVTKHIKNAIKSIGKQIPSLSAHLTNAIRTGAKCCYQPDPNNPIQWTILWNN
jgi:hypothetical protein